MTTKNRTSLLIEAIHSSLDMSLSKTLPDDILSIEGYSGKRFKKFLNCLLSQTIVENYLEIGVWKGSTSISGLYENQNRVKHTVIDNFSQFGGHRNTFIQNWLHHLKTQPNLIDGDCFEIDPIKSGIREVDLYFYDGDHKSWSHSEALKHYKDSMKDSFIYIVDDWNWEQVKVGTHEGIVSATLKIECLVEFHHPPAQYSTENWWNGCGIFVLSK